MELHGGDPSGWKRSKSPPSSSTPTPNTCAKALRQWLRAWKARDWRTADKKPVKNRDLWEQLDAATERHSIEWRWVKGHSGVPGNERVDALRQRRDRCDGENGRVLRLTCRACAIVYDAETTGPGEFRRATASSKSDVLSSSVDDDPGERFHRYLKPGALTSKRARSQARGITRRASRT
jgi:hypothetical protein